jgi:hypothetical protein
MEDYEFDVSFDWKDKQHKIFLDLGEQSVTLSRQELEYMLDALNEADLSM